MNLEREYIEHVDHLNSQMHSFYRLFEETHTSISSSRLETYSLSIRQAFIQDTILSPRDKIQKESKDIEIFHQTQDDKDLQEQDDKHD